MSWTVVIDEETLAIKDWYINQTIYTAGIHKSAPEGLDPQCIMAVSDPETGAITLQEDPAKVAKKTADQWTSVRAQQRQKLYESDWTCSVTDYEVPNKPDWVQYRQALRNVTTQSDPFAIVWPMAPEDL